MSSGEILLFIFAFKLVTKESVLSKKGRRGPFFGRCYSLKFPDFCEILRIFQQIEHFSPQISRNFAGIAGNDRELLEVYEFCRKMQKHFRGKGKTEGMGKREFEIECREMGNGIAPNLKWQPSSRNLPVGGARWRARAFSSQPDSRSRDGRGSQPLAA